MPEHPYRPGTAPWLRVPLVRRFVSAHGWRAYGVAALAIITVVAVVVPGPRRDRTAQADTGQRNSGPSSTRHSPASSPTNSTTRTGAAGDAQKASTNSPVAPPAASCRTNTLARFVVVSISAQHAWMCQGTTRVKDSPVTTGRDGANYTTPTGTWQVYGKQTDRDLVGPGYSEFVQYWVPYSGDFGFHDASWQTMPFGDRGYHSQGSHGCVHLPTPMMKWLYSWIAVGSTVTVTT